MAALALGSDGHGAIAVIGKRDAGTLGQTRKVSLDGHARVRGDGVEGLTGSPGNDLAVRDGTRGKDALIDAFLPIAHRELGVGRE